MNRSMQIGKRRIGPGEKPYIIAEMSANHNGSLEQAIAILEAAKKAGADALKLQTYTPETMTLDMKGPGFQIEGGLWNGRSLYELYQEAHTPWEWHPDLFKRGRELDIDVFSSPFDVTAVDFLEKLDPPAYKIASFEITDLPLIRHVARTGKPMIMSTGMATMQEIQESVSAAREAGVKSLALLHCVSGYPTPASEANLHMIELLADSFDLPVGLSDHTLDIGVAVASIAKGAVLVEKHFMLSRTDGGPDSAFSAEPDELAALVRNTALASAACRGEGFARGASERGNRELRRSLYVVQDIPAGGVLTADNIRAIRPGYGLAPKFYDEILGKQAARAIPRGTPLSWDLIA